MAKTMAPEVSRLPEKASFYTCFPYNCSNVHFHSQEGPILDDELSVLPVTMENKGRDSGSLTPSPSSSHISRRQKTN